MQLRICRSSEQRKLPLDHESTVSYSMHTDRPVSRSVITAHIKNPLVTDFRYLTDLLELYATVMTRLASERRWDWCIGIKSIWIHCDCFNEHKWQCLEPGRQWRSISSQNYLKTTAVIWSKAVIWCQMSSGTVRGRVLLPAPAQYWCVYFHNRLPICILLIIFNNFEI